MPETIYTIGHSNLSAEEFVRLAKSQGVEAIADVRSAPYSRYNPQFDREILKETLRAAGVEYVYLGKELGARTDDPACYLKGKVQFAKLARTALFQDGLDRALAGAGRFRVALMCAEKEPLECHRSILVARALVERGVAVRHILPDGSVETQDAMLDRLMEALRLDTGVGHLFLSREELVADAYRMQEERIAFNWNAVAKEPAA
jgi:uncharacterized protein (DUF488 family)